ncbi:hypothetical protein E2C01_030013 [Portunus trituberculatus]|uniref:Uncharacterized protein n=1 Tax=Portunus trituberculatus TaxID=210409 RepID=A0A5B7EQX7_PORTR|nr:hypothetical protein [Portunus trituberculatus]
MKHWTIEQWCGVMWSDESRFKVTASSQGRVYQRPSSNPLDPSYTAPAIRFPDSLMYMFILPGVAWAKGATMSMASTVHNGLGRQRLKQTPTTKKQIPTFLFSRFISTNAFALLLLFLISLILV